MMSSEDCWLKSAMCEANAESCGKRAERATWLRMAADWRGLAGDRDAQATTARLMGRDRSDL